MKKIIILVMVVLVILIVGGILVYERLGKGEEEAGIEEAGIKEEIKTEEGVSVTLKLENGQTLNAIAGKFSPSYVVQFRDPSSDFNLRLPTEVLDALWSTPNRNSQKYLSLLDAGAKTEELRLNQETGGRVLAETEKDKPFPAPDQLQTFFDYWVELNINNKLYRVMVGRSIVEGEEFSGLTITLVKQGDYWLLTYDLTNSPILFTLGTETYEQLIRGK
ncbi:hypothetical protein KKE19_03195 [Patescibacteria group bacterium]|nr:hypothetical protein [Patescibacteria group bacterium]MBU4367786.1 hypothetical protein [Patescibacteria group bacterium]MBU4461476.1 hypothetical protein [Patescibacteria group bacterium]MCG2700392.1 hypothetical protein [Candidatus Parcubacteria bacterium]